MSDPAPTPPTIPANPVPAPITSPTGEAQLKLPPWLSWLLVGVAAALATVSQLPVLVPGFVLDPKLAALALLLSIALAAMGISSAGARKGGAAIVVLLAAAALLIPTPARAEGLTAGPSLPFLAVTPGDTHPVSLAPGAGISVGGDLFPTTLVGRPVHWLSVGGDVFGSLLASSGAYNLSVAVHAAVLELFTIGVGLKLLDSGGHGALEHFDGRTAFVLLGLDYGLLNAFIYGHAGEAPQQACDGDHPCG